MNHLEDEDLVMIFYNEPEVSPAQKAHLSSCSVCRENFEALSRTLRLADEWQAPEPPADFERTVWARLAPALEDKPRFLLQIRFWFPAVVFALLLVGVFFLGRATRTAAKPVFAGLSEKARDRILVISLADHLERTGVLLTDLSNNADGVELASFNRERARDLVSEGRTMQNALELRGDRTKTEMLDELDRFLLEVANAPDQVPQREMREWRQRIDNDSLLFKVRVVESNLRTKGQTL